MFNRINYCAGLLKRSSLNNTKIIRWKSRTSSTQKVTPTIINIIKSTEKFTAGITYNGFLCTKTLFVPDFNMMTYVFQHEKTKSKYLHVERDDSNNVFSINFRTTPFDSTGLPHILEHSVLCGSEKFPIRDPFFKMLTRSVATFMNAMTGPDYTLYPFSTMNEIDYRNLQRIYLDAVFKPNLKYLDFLQEGWRLENSDLQDIHSDYVIKGVVYNEMKGAFSENSAVFGQHFFNKILPDHTYGYVSGGDPLVIPNLTHEGLINFHDTYYHPSNARFYSYGNFNVLPTLKFIDEVYMQNCSPISTDYSKIPPQRRWQKPVKSQIVSRYDNMGAPLAKQNQIAIGYLMTDITDIYETFVMHVISELMIKGPNACFYKSLIEPNISGGYNQITGFDPNMKDTLFTIGLQDLYESDFGKVEQIFDETINKVIETGFTKEHIDSVLHNLELQMMHQTPKFGLGLLFNLTPLWNHDGDITTALNIGLLIAQLRSNILRSPTYLQEKVEFYFKNNKHKLVMTMTPSENYDKLYSDKEEKLLASKVSKLTSADKQTVFENGLNLAKSQLTKEDTNILPCLQLEDIPKAIDKINITEKSIAGVPTLFCQTNTNNVIYLKGILDGSELSSEQKLLLPLLATVINQFGTKNYDYRSFDQLIQTKTSGINFSLHFTENIHNMSNYEIGLQFKSYCLDSNIDAMFKIYIELFNALNMTDVSRFKMLLENYMSTLSIGIADAGHLYAIQSCNGLITEAAKLKESMMGIEHIEYMKNLLKTKDAADILTTLKQMATILLNKNSMRCSLNVTDQQYTTVTKIYKDFVKKLPVNKLRFSTKNTNDTTGVNWLSSLNLPSSCRHNIINTSVNYCAKSIITVPFTHKDYSVLKVLAKLLTSKYLLPVVREQNGAYGAGAKINLDGIFNFFSYRDPNTRKTLDTFDNANNWMLTELNKIDKQTLFEAKLGVLQQMDAPIAPGDKGSEHFKHQITQELFAEQRERILEVDLNELVRVSNLYLARDYINSVGKCVLGPVTNHLEKPNEKWTFVKQE